jgi:hypothetical protein
MQINTSQCAFPATPLYFTSISGISSHWIIFGVGAIVQPTNQSFQIYARSILAGFSATLLYNYSQTYAWDVDWIGATVEKRTYNL